MSNEQLLPYDIAFADHEDKFLFACSNLPSVSASIIFFQSFSVKFKWTSVNMSKGFEV